LKFISPFVSVGLLSSGFKKKMTSQQENYSIKLKVVPIKINSFLIVHTKTIMYHYTTDINIKKTDPLNFLFNDTILVNQSEVSRHLIKITTGKSNIEVA